jgi:hypothetical protein
MVGCIPELKQLQSVSYRFAWRGNYLNTPDTTAFSVDLLDFILVELFPVTLYLLCQTLA